MATIVQQHQPTVGSSESAARQFWRAKMERHPNIAGLLAIAGEVAGFFLNGHCIVALARWIIRVSGYVAESALLFAVLWISGTSVAPHLVELVMSEKTMQYFVSVALIALALIPEIILANAIVNTLGHIHTASQQRTPVAWAWAGLFTLPTLLFLGLTAYTLNTLVANGGNFVQASAGLVGLRCFAGWTYGLLEMVYAGVGRRMVNQAQPVITPAQPVAPAMAQQIDYEEIVSLLLPLIAQEVRQAVPDTNGMVEQLHQLRADVEGLTQRIAKSPETIDETENETNITSVEDAKFHLKLQENETDLETETLPTPRITVKLKQERSTAKKASSVETKSETNNARGTARQKALRVIKRNPDINASELAKRARITPQYASQILKQQA
jgi:hypothetical protein